MSKSKSVESPRVSSNPLADEHERRHCKMLDEIHRLVAEEWGGCVIMPKGVSGGGREDLRRSTDAECGRAEIWFDVTLDLTVSGETIAEDAVCQLKGFAHEVLDLADRVEQAGQRLESSSKRKPAKTR